MEKGVQPGLVQQKEKTPPTASVRAKLSRKEYWEDINENKFFIK
jgi:hypothetical protein